MAKVTQINNEPKKKSLTVKDVMLVRAYFEESSLEGFCRNNDGCLRLDSPHMGRGYVFVYALQLDRDHERRMEEEIRLAKGLGRNVKRKFTDYSEDLSGFYWEK